MSTLGKRIAAARKARGMTQEEVGRLASLPTSAVGRLESEGEGSRAHVRSDVLARLALALDVTSDYLLGIDDRTPQPLETD